MPDQRLFGKALNFKNLLLHNPIPNEMIDMDAKTKVFKAISELNS